MASGTRKRIIIIGVIAAVVALLTVATTAFAAGFGGRHGFAAPGSSNPPANAQSGSYRGFGPRAVVTAVDTTSQTITLGGLPQQIATVKVDQSVKLAAIQPDGTTKDAAFTDFTTGSFVEVHFQFNGRGGGRGPGKPGNNPGQPGNAPNQPSANLPKVTELALVPAGQVNVSGLVTATGGTLTIVDGGGLQLTINAGSVKVTKGTAAANVSDIKVGDRIMVTGTQNGATVNATTLRIFDPSAIKPGMRPGRKPGVGSPAAPPSA